MRTQEEISNKIKKEFPNLNNEMHERLVNKIYMRIKDNENNHSSSLIKIAKSIISEIMVDLYSVWKCDDDKYNELEGGAISLYKTL